MFLRILSTLFEFHDECLHWFCLREDFFLCLLSYHSLFLDLVQTVHGQEEPIVSGVFHHQQIDRTAAAQGSGFKAAIASDSMFDVDDEVAQVPFVDFGTALFAAYGTMAALMEREKSGKGQMVEASLFSTSLAFNTDRAIMPTMLQAKR